MTTQFTGPGWRAPAAPAATPTPPLSRFQYIEEGDALALSIVAYGGAVGDGADDTAAVQKTMDALGDNGGGFMLIPAGTYITDPITARQGVTIYGVGSGNFDASGDGSSIVSELQLANGANDSLIIVPGSTRSVHFQGVCLNGNKANQSGTSHVVEVQDYDGLGTADDCDVTTSDCYLRDALSDNYYVGALRRGPRIINTRSYGAGRHGFNTTSSDAGVENSVFGLNGGSGIETTNGPTNVTGCNIFRNLIGINFNSNSAAFGAGAIAGCGIDRNEQEGVRLETANVTIIGNMFDKNSRAANDTYSNVYVDSYPGNIVVYNVFNATATEQANAPRYNIQAAGTDVANAVIGRPNRHVTGSNVSGDTSSATHVKTWVSETAVLDATVSWMRSGAASVAAQSFVTGEANARYIRNVDGAITRGFGSAAGATKFIFGTGSPEGVQTAGIGSIYQRTDGGAGTSMYVKESGAGNTGWVAK